MSDDIADHAGILIVKLKVLCIAQARDRNLDRGVRYGLFSCRPYSLILEANFIEIELRQKRSPVGEGPSLNRCPRCAPHLWHITSVLIIPALVSVSVVMFCSESGAQKLGQPVPESYLVSELNSSLPQKAH